MESQCYHFHGRFYFPGDMWRNWFCEEASPCISTGICRLQTHQHPRAGEELREEGPHLDLWRQGWFMEASDELQAAGCYGWVFISTGGEEGRAEEPRSLRWKGRRREVATQWTKGGSRSKKYLPHQEPWGHGRMRIKDGGQCITPNAASEVTALFWLAAHRLFIYFPQCEIIAAGYVSLKRNQSAQKPRPRVGVWPGS